MAGLLKKFFSKKEVEVEVTSPIEPIVSSPEETSALEEISLPQLSDWLKEQEKQFLTNSNLEEELKEYVASLRECGKRINQQIDQWIDGMDLSKLHYTTVGEINFLFSDAQTIVKLVHTQHPLNLDNVGRFNSVLQERLRVLTKKIEDASFGEELAFLFKLTSEEHLTSEEDFKEVKEGKSYLAHPLWRDLQHLLQLKEEFSRKMNSSRWQKLGVMQRLQIHLSVSQTSLQQLQFRLKINQQHLQQELENRENKEREIAVLRHESGFEELEERQEHLVLLSPEMEQVKQKVLLFFSPLQPYLQQLLQFDKDNSILEDYLSSYLTAFYEDEELNIFTIIRKLRLCMEDERVKVEPEDLALILDRVEQVNSGAMRELHKEYVRMRRQFQEAEKSTNRALSMKYEDLKYRLDHFEVEILRLKKQIKELEEQIKVTESSQHKAKERFESLAKDYFGKDVEVVI